MTKQIALHDDDVWIVARFIQFLYESSYENGREGGYDFYGPKPNVRLRDIVGQHCKSETEVDTNIERQHRSVHTHCMVVLLADKYDVPNLLEYAARQLSEEVRWALYDCKDKFWACFHEVGMERIRRHESLQEVFASLMVKLFPDLGDDRLRQWCQDDPRLTHKVNQHLSQEVARWNAEALRIDALLPKSKRRWTAS